MAVLDAPWIVVFLQRGRPVFGTWWFLPLERRSLRLLGWGPGCVGEEVVRGLLAERGGQTERPGGALGEEMPLRRMGNAIFLRGRWRHVKLDPALVPVSSPRLCNQLCAATRVEGGSRGAPGTESSRLWPCSYSCLPKQGINSSCFYEYVGPMWPGVPGVVWFLLWKALWKVYIGCAFSSCFVIQAQCMAWLLLACKSGRWIWPDEKGLKKTLELPGV